MSTKAQATETTQDEINAALAVAEQAQQNARRLQEQADQAEAQRKAQRDTTTEEFYKNLNPHDPKLIETINERRTAFEEAVRNDNNYRKAWVEYQSALAAVSVRDTLRENYLHQRAIAKHEALAAQVNEWNNELAQLHNSRNAGTPVAGPYRKRGWWDTHVPGLSAKTIAQLKQANTRIEQLNIEINETTKSYGSTYVRPTDTSDQVIIGYIMDRPGNLRPSTGRTTQYERRTLREAVEEITSQQVEAATKQARQDLTAELEQYISEHTN